jgi:hypothetical protein
MHGPDGKPVYIHADQLEISPDGRWLYYHSGPLYRIETRDRRRREHLPQRHRPAEDHQDHAGGECLDAYTVAASGGDFRSALIVARI